MFPMQMDGRTQMRACGSRRDVLSGSLAKAKIPRHKASFAQGPCEEVKTAQTTSTNDLRKMRLVAEAPQPMAQDCP